MASHLLKQLLKTHNRRMAPCSLSMSMLLWKEMEKTLSFFSAGILFVGPLQFLYILAQISTTILNAKISEFQNGPVSSILLTL